MNGGMDFPDDLTTNVFRAGEFKEIYWAFYTRKAKDEAPVQHRQSSEQGEEDSSHMLQRAECILREDGRHVLLDKDRAGVWIFSLSQAQDQGIAQNLGLDGLESISIGSVRSEDLIAAVRSNASAPSSIKTERATHTTAATTADFNRQAYGSNVSSNTRPSIIEPGHRRLEALDASHDHSVSEVYSNFVSAVSCSLSHSLAKAPEWIQVGPYACMYVRTLEDDPFDDSELHSWAATTTQLSFDVRWLSSGTLLISFFQARLPRHTRISTILSKDGHPTGLTAGSPLLLSPSGVRCQYLGTEDLPKNDVQRESTLRSKASILSCLANQGMRNVQDITWIQVGPPVTLWPAEVCLCEEVMLAIEGQDGASFNKSIVDGSTDPLEEAQSWFLGKAARIEALQARVREDNQAIPISNDVEDTEDEDALSPFEISMDQGITPQDVSGIYPTPPDGLPPALIGSANANNLQSGDYDDEGKELQPSEEARGDYDGHENDDLFGDMDIDMFASNGLTEADFSFFDEPGMLDEDLRKKEQVMNLDNTHQTEHHPTAFDEQRLTRTPNEGHDSRPGRDGTKDEGDVIGEQENGQVSLTTDDHLPDKDYEKDPKSTNIIEDVDYEALEQLYLHRGLTFQDAHGGQRSSFEHVPFQGSTVNVDDKYNMQGRFTFDMDELPIHPKHEDHRPDRESRLLKFGVFPEKSPVEDSVNEADDDEDAPAPEDSDSHYATDLSPELKAESSRKRKREQPDENDPPVTPSTSISQLESQAGSPQLKLNEPLADFLEPLVLERTKDNADYAPRVHGHPKPSFTGRGQTFLEVARLIAYQAVSGLLQSQNRGIDPVGERLPHGSLDNTMTHLLSTLFPKNKRCSLKEYVSVGVKTPPSVSREQVLLNQRSLKPTNISAGPIGTGRSIFKLDSPYTHVRRNGVPTELSASALSFWEELSLGPSHETKDIDVFCICPKNEYIEEGVMAFLNMIKGAYQSCNLGSHDLGLSLADFGNRIVTAPMDANKPDNFLQNIAATCESLGTKLPELGSQSTTTVVYIINPFKDQQYLPRLCDALLRLPNSYGAALEKRRLERRNDFVMQIVPLDMVWSPDFIVMPSPADYRRLAFEVYNKCGSSDSGHNKEPYFMSAPAIRLAKAVPKIIDFKLVSETSASFMQSDNCVHVSYTWNATNEWLAATWTDNIGVLSWSACYCLGKNEITPWQPFYEAAKEILETSLEMFYPPNAPWRLFICKDSPVLTMENDAWLRALADSSRPSTSCTILTIEVDPPLTLTHSDIQRSSSDLAPGLLATPGTTPLTNTPSPDILGLGSTPAGNATQVGTPPANVAISDHDSEARLVDITDETWGIVMDGTLDDRRTLSDKPASVASGYLVKRAGPRDEDGLIPLGVHLVHGQKPYKAVLKEILGMYRNLGTLARVRGVEDPVKSVLPFHVAAARKAWKALSETMRYKPA